MRPTTLKIGDDVVHQSHPGRFTVVKIQQRPAMNINSNIITLRSADGVELTVLDTSVRRVDKQAKEPTADQG